MTASDDGEQGQLAPLSLLVVSANGELAAICASSVQGLDGVESSNFTDQSLALAWANNHELAGVVVDNELPGMDAAAFIRQVPLVASRPRPHVILVCEGTPHEVSAAARNAGVDDVVTKPVVPGTFANLVRSAVTLRLAERADRPQIDAGPPAQAPAATAPLEPPGPPAPPGSPAPPSMPTQSPSRRRAARLWLALGLLIMLLLVGCYRYHELTSARRPAVATTNPESASSPQARPTATGVAAALPGAEPAGTGDSGTLASSRATPPAGGSVAGGVAVAGTRFGALSGGAPPVAYRAATHSNAGLGGASAGGGSSVGAALPAAHGSGAGAAPHHAAGSPAGAGAGSPSGGASPPSAAAGGGAAGASAPGAGSPAGGGGKPVAAAGKSNGAGAAATGPAGAKPLTAPADGGFLVLDAAGHSVGQSQPDTARAPASTIKVLTAAVAIATLGADARFRTQLVAQGGVRDGAIEGSLALVGGGDPLLTSADIDAAAAELERRGVREIRGDVVIDATAFTGPEHNARWTAADRAAPYGAGTSAVSIDGGTRVRLVNGASTVQTIADQRSYAGSVLQDRLRAHHITIDGSVHAGRSAGGTVLWSHDSPPLAALIRTMLIESDNHVAEQLLREIGLASGGTGSEDAGIARMRTYLAQHNIPTDGLQLYDGSGLAYDDRATPRTLATLMWRIAGTPEGNIIHDSLTPTGNRSGQSEADGFIRLKTGRADTARGIVGSVDRGPAGPLSFAFLDHVNRTAASSGPRQALEETELHRLAHAAP